MGLVNFFREVREMGAAQQRAATSTSRRIDADCEQIAERGRAEHWTPDQIRLVQRDIRSGKISRGSYEGARILG